MPSFSPMLTPVFSQAASQMAQSLCGSSKQCKFDCAATENALLAQSSANNSKGADLALKELGNWLDVYLLKKRNIVILILMSNNIKNQMQISW